MYLRIFFLLSAVVVCSGARTEPKIFWASYPVGKGEHVLLHGADFGRAPTVVTDKGEIVATNLSDSGIAFRFPGDDDEIVTVTVRAAKGMSSRIVLNAPTVWWLQGDAGDSSTPGGKLRVFGRALASGKGDKKPRLRLGTRELSVLHADEWNCDWRIPDGMNAGIYRVSVRNGLKGEHDWTDCGEWVVKRPRAVWKTRRYDVTRYGATRNDPKDDTEAFERALADAGKNGGGSVFVPAGRYTVSRTLSIPPHVLLMGEGREVSQIAWLDSKKPLHALISGTHSFGIHDLFLSSGWYCNGIAVGEVKSGQGHMSQSNQLLTHDISLKKLYLKFVSDQWRDSDAKTSFLPRYMTLGDGIVIRNCLRGTVEDCEIHCDKWATRTLYFHFTGKYIRMSGCRVSGSGWAIFGGENCIFENNESFNCTYSVSSVCRNLFWSGNVMRDIYTQNREGVTHDGAKVAFCAKKRGEEGCASGSCDNVRLSLVVPDGIEWKCDTNDCRVWKGYDVQIAEGRGVGQTRRVVDMSGFSDMKIDRPFDVEPDASSRFIPVAERRHLLYIDNDISDAGVAIQLFGGATDAVVARNRCRRAGGFVGSGRDYHGILTCWYLQFLGNVIEEGNTHRNAVGTDWWGPNGGSFIGGFPVNVGRGFSQSYIIRDNEIKSNGSIMVNAVNAVVEGNTVMRSDRPVVIGQFGDSVMLGVNDIR